MVVPVEDFETIEETIEDYHNRMIFYHDNLNDKFQLLVN